LQIGKKGGVVVNKADGKFGFLPMTSEGLSARDGPSGFMTGRLEAAECAFRHQHHDGLLR